MKGKKTSPEEIKKIMALWLISENAEDVARQMGKPVSTVKGIIYREKDKPEYNEVKQKMKLLYSDDMLRIAKKALKRLEKVIDDEEADIPIHHITTVIGTLIDKLRVIHEDGISDADGGGVVEVTQTITIKSPEDDGEGDE